VCARFKAKRFVQQPFERRGMSPRRPDFQLRVSRGPHLQQGILAAVVQLEARDRL